MSEQDQKKLIIENLVDSLQENPEALFAITSKDKQLPLVSCSGDRDLLVKLISKCMAEESMIAEIIIDAVAQFPLHKLAHNERKNSSPN